MVKNIRVDIIDKAYLEIFKIVMKYDLNPFEIIIIIKLMELANDGVMKDIKDDLIKKKRSLKNDIMVN